MNVARLIKYYDKDLYWHCYNTANYTERLAVILNDDPELMYNAALLHDIGKIMISPLLWNKKTAFSNTDREIADFHSYFGYQILKGYGFDEEFCQIVLFHHGTDKERVGVVPNPSKEVIFRADMLRCCDIYDALTEDRVYREHLSSSKALEILEKSDIPQDILAAMETMIVHL